MTSEYHLNWTTLYINRLFRIYPLYLFAVLSVYVIVYLSGRATGQVDVFSIFKELFFWSIFEGESALGFEWAKLIMAGVFWSLVSEAVFYVLLPAINFFLKNLSSSRRGPPNLRWSKPLFVSTLLLAMLFVALWPIRHQVHLEYFIFFAIGGCCVFVRRHLLKQNAELPFFASDVVHVLTAACLLVALLVQTNSLPQITALAIAFFCISCGNSLFGILKKDASIFLGEISYGTYLIHGISLYLLFNSLKIPVGTWIHFGVVITAATVPLVILSYLAHVLIEVKSVNAGRYIAGVCARHR